MLLYEDAEDRIRDNLTRISSGEKAGLIAIGAFSVVQFDLINSRRALIGLHELEENEIVFIGRHLYQSRARDFYTVDDMLLQISAALSDQSEVLVKKGMSCIRSTMARSDGYGNNVFDQAVFEMTARKPRAELFSVIPKGDLHKPQKR